MQKNRILKVLNPLLAVLLISQIASGLSGMRLSYKVFNVVHKGGAFVLLTCALLHIVLNWSWIRATYFKKRASSSK
jgi:hypothetical protein